MSVSRARYGHIEDCLKPPDAANEFSIFCARLLNMPFWAPRRRVWYLTAPYRFWARDRRRSRAPVLKLLLSELISTYNHHGDASYTGCEILDAKIWVGGVSIQNQTAQKLVRPAFAACRLVRRFRGGILAKFWRGRRLSKHQHGRKLHRDSQTRR